MRPRGLNMAIQGYHRRSDQSQDHNGVTSASKSSAVSAQEGGILYWPACWVVYKRKSGRAQSLVCSQWSTAPHPSWTQPELHHLDTVCWISKFPIVSLSLGAPWSTGAPLSINQANWACPFQEGAPLFHQLGKVSAPLSGGRFPCHLSNSVPRT